jgi:acetyltransferase EpsM
VNEGAHIGLNSCIREDVVIGKYSIVGMGAVIIKKTDPYSIYVGNPGKKIGEIDTKGVDE